MELKIMKMDMYVLSVLQSKGLLLDDFLKLTDDELDAHDLPMKVTDHIKDMRTRSYLSTQEIKEVLNDAKEQVESVSPIEAEEITMEYAVEKEDPEKTTLHIDVGDVSSDEAQEQISNIVEEFTKEEVPETVVIERVVSNPDVLDQVNTLLQSKELKTLASYNKLIRTEMSKEDLAKVDNAQLVSMINERIAEVKSK